MHHKNFEMAIVSEQISTPDKHNKNNYMLDTVAYNRISENIGCHLPILEMSLKLGYKYYITDVQAAELSGIRINEYGDVDDRSKSIIHKSNDFMLIKNKLSIYRTLQQMSNFPKRARLDGSVFLPVEDANVMDLYKCIYKGNHKQFEDATIATSAIVMNCVLVTADKRLFAKVKEVFPNKVLKYNDLIQKINCELNTIRTQP